MVIVGGGFGGLYAARSMRKLPVRITLIDRRNHHLFQPLLYQVATAALNPSDIAMPIRSVVRSQKNITVLLGDVERVEAAAKKLHLADGGEVAFDHLIVAAGATHSYFGHDEWAVHAPGLKSLEDATEIRRRVLLAYEMAERTDDEATRRDCLTFVVVGAGPTGVELAGALAEIAHHSLSRDFRRINPEEARVILLEGADRVLPQMDPTLSAKAERQLTSLGVEVRTKTRVTGIDEQGVHLGAEKVGARTVLWGAGVAGAPLAKTLGVPLDRAGRVMVKPDLTIPGHDSIFVIGDLAAMETDGKAVPGVAPAAIQQGKFVAANLRRRLRGEPMKDFRYRDKGSLATIGRSRGVAHVGKLKLGGFFAWFMWLAIHIFFLIGFRNRVLVMLEWAWSYVTFRRGARLITGATPKQLPPPRG